MNRTRQRSLFERLTKLAASVRRLPLLASIVELSRPLYQKALLQLFPGGIERVINGTDTLIISAHSRADLSVVEPESWQPLMNRLRPGDVFVDVGANIGLFTIAILKRQSDARAVAFEPDRANFEALRENVRLNEVGARVTLLNAFVGDSDGEVAFASGLGPLSHFNPSGSTATRVRSVTLDSVLGEDKVDLLKIDAEGFEEPVIRGAAKLFGDERRRPRSIYVDLHPELWKGLGLEPAWTGIEASLRGAGYRFTDWLGAPLIHLEGCTEFFADRL